MQGLERMSELMPERGAVSDKHRKKLWEQKILFHVDLFNVVCLTKTKTGTGETLTDTCNR